MQKGSLCQGQRGTKSLGYPVYTGTWTLDRKYNLLKSQADSGFARWGATS